MTRWLGQFLGMLGLAAAAGAAEPAAPTAAAPPPAAPAPAIRPAPPTPVEPGRYLYLVYFIPSDRGEGEPRWRERLERVLRDIQAFYRDGMEKNGFGPRTFPLEEGPDGKLKFHVVRGARPFSFYTFDRGDDMQQEIVAALRAEGIDSPRETVLVLHATSVTEGARTWADCPYYGLSDWCFANDQEWIDTLNLPKREPWVEYKGRSMPIGEFASTMIGGIAHETGHSLGLPHVREPKDAPATALMGGGNYTYKEELRGAGRGSYLSAPSATLLSRHPLFTGDRTERELRGSVQLTALAARQDGNTLVLEGRFTATLPVVQLVLFNDNRRDGTAVNQDYDETGWRAEVSPEGSFTARVGDFSPGSYLLKFYFVHRNGSFSRMNFTYSVDDRGIVDSETFNRHFIMQRAFAAFRRRQADQLAAEAQALAPAGESESLRRIRQLQALLTAVPGPAPAELPADTSAAWLSDLRPERVRVGWGAPTTNRTPDDNQPLLLFCDRLYAKGLFAHAPSFHTYRLGGGWTTFTSTVAVLDDHAGTVRFVVRGDGRELFHSEVLSGETAAAVRVDVRGVQTLELLTDDGDDGNGSDWGAWLEPRLER